MNELRKLLILTLIGLLFFLLLSGCITQQKTQPKQSNNTQTSTQSQLTSQDLNSTETVVNDLEVDLNDLNDLVSSNEISETDSGIDDNFFQ